MAEDRARAIFLANERKRREKNASRKKKKKKMDVPTKVIAAKKYETFTTNSLPPCDRDDDYRDDD
jgi:hypothetical protein